MNVEVVLLIAVILLLGVVLGVATRFYENAGGNIGRIHMKELGLDEEDGSERQDKE